MKGPDQYEMDDQLMDELGGAMDDYDEKKVHPVVSITIATGHGEGCQCPDCAKAHAEPDGDEAMPTPEEMEELQKALS